MKNHLNGLVCIMDAICICYEMLYLSDRYSVILENAPSHQTCDSYKIVLHLRNLFVAFRNQLSLTSTRPYVYLIIINSWSRGCLTTVNKHPVGKCESHAPCLCGIRMCSIPL